MIGGIVWGIGMALMEETVLDRRTGTIVTANLADYHVPVNADIPPLDIHFVEKPDYTLNALGARGVGEIGITGVAAAIANAVYHATGTHPAGEAVVDGTIVMEPVMPYTLAACNAARGGPADLAGRMEPCCSSFVARRWLLRR